jgi:predicted TIM-barrel fold metal-dependent hydrolase
LKTLAASSDFEPVMLIDTQVHLGRWPFALGPDLTAKQLAAHLRSHGIRRALVSPLAAVLAPDPMPANSALFAAVRRLPALVPVPVVNPCLANWREQLAACLGACAIKLFPNYHNYRLDSRRLDPFCAEVRARKLRLLINLRLEDDRHRYFGLRVIRVPVTQVAAFLERHPRLHPLLLGLLTEELRGLAKSHRNFSADTSFIEFMDSIPTLVKEFPARRLLFGSNTPFFTTGASMAKITTMRLPARARTALGHANAKRFYSL